MNDLVSNTPELSVSELSGALKRTVEDAFGHVRLRGELSGYRGPHSSGHVYFSLKDAGAKIDAVIWKGVFSRIKFRPEDGMEVIATGRITTFPGKSSYQIVVEQMEPAGVGALLAQLEERRKRLAAEGLFAPERKKRLPFLPAVVGIITSPTGAVIRDMIHRLSDRFPRQVLLWPVRVQGEGSAEEVAAAIRGFNAIPITTKSGLRFSDQGDGKKGWPNDDLPRPDVIVVARGGGSLEDLWSFNEEIVLRAVAECDIPLVSAIGHETDTTLIDFVSDVRAPTPTAAAEMIVPVRAELLADTRASAARLVAAITRAQERRRRDLASLARALPAPERALEGPRQRLDRAVMRAQNLIQQGLDKRRLALGKLAHKLSAQAPAARLAQQRQRFENAAKRLPTVALNRQRLGQQALTPLAHRLTRAMQTRIALEKRDGVKRRSDLEKAGARLLPAFEAYRKRLRQRFSASANMLKSLSYKSVLARGYAVVRSEGGILSQAARITPGMALGIEFADGTVAVQAGGDAAPPASRTLKSKPQESGPKGNQGSLF